MTEKYIIAYTIPHKHQGAIHELMDTIAIHTKLPSPYLSMPAHITFHRPIVGISEEKICKLVQSMVLQMKKTTVTLSGIYSFGKHYMVLTVHATYQLATFWVGMKTLLSILPEYEHGEFDMENTLHITLAKKTSQVFDTAWPEVQKIVFDPIDVDIEHIDIYQKINDERWDRIARYSIAA
jgi:2'-5' RNA ligase